MNRGQTGQAVAELKRADTLAPDMPETLLELGKALALSGDAASAEKRLRRLLELEDTSPLAEAAHLQPMQIYRRLGAPPMPIAK
ncbi:MAG: tetratricopeptide repeat protein [Bryobacteraceae bacterium]